MYFLLQYLKHLLTATNQYGVHSPFVYSYLTKCLYTKSKYQASKSEKIVLKSIPYFSVEKIKISSKNSQIENLIRKEFKLTTSDNESYDLIYMNNPVEDILSIYKEKIHNDSAIFMGNIHRTKETTALWETLKHNEMVTVSIDMFHCGVLFFRKEQLKEHFKIRI